MGSKHIKRRVLAYEKPWIRHNPKPPKARTLLGMAFSNANYQGVLKLQHCEACAAVNYPPREVCRNCLNDKLVWRDTSPEGEILSVSELFHSQWEFFKRKVETAPWPIVTVKVAGEVLFAHLAPATFADIDASAPLSETLLSGTPIKVFSASDSSYNSVLIAVSIDTDVSKVAQRVAIVDELGLRVTD